jgi:hypothetical protein
VSAHRSLPIVPGGEPVGSDAEPLPPLYGRWLAEALGHLPPREVRADCSNCPMTGINRERHPEGAIQFLPSAKCCTYLPDLPNFLVGMVLLDQSVPTVGRQTVVERIERVVGVTPLGLIRTPVYGLIYDSIKPAGFGRTEVMRCPHYLPDEGGRCGIWQYRNSMCSTFFCKHRSGPVGAALWNAIRALLYQLERELSIWSAAELHIPAAGIAKSGIERTGNVREHVLSELQGSGMLGWSGPDVWGEWQGQVGEYFMRCASLVAAQSWPEVVGICGPEVRVRLNGVLDCLREADVSLPTEVHLDECRTLPGPEGTVWIGTYSPHDWLSIDLGLWHAVSSSAGLINVARFLEEASKSGQDPDRYRSQLKDLLDWGALKGTLGEVPGDGHREGAELLAGAPT